MIKLSLAELNIIRRTFSFYDFQNHNSLMGQILVKFKDDYEITRFDDVQFGGLLEDFMKQANILKSIAFKLIGSFSTENIVIAKYQPKWIIDSNKSPILAEAFRLKKLRANFSGAISVKDTETIEEFFYANFKYNSFTHFIIPDSKIIITPTDHLDLFIVSDDINKTFEIVSKIIDDIDIDKVVTAEYRT